MTILITGAKGQLGNELTKILGEGTSSLGVLPLFYAQSKVISVDVDELDITDRWRFLLVLACLALALGIGVLYAYSNYRLVASGLDSNGRREIQLACINELNLK